MVKKDKLEPSNDAVTVCPVCGSTNVETDFSNPLVWAAGTPSNYKCHSCGHVGTFFPQIDRDKVKEYQAKVKEKLSK